MNLAHFPRFDLRAGLRRFGADRKGAMAVTLGLLMTSFAGMAALSVDVADWYGARRALQSAADAGALGGELALQKGSTSAQAQAAGTTDAQLNGKGLGAGATVNVVVNATAQTVTATVSKRADMLLAGVFLGSAPTITATATASVVSTASSAVPPVCLLVTSPAAANVVQLSGSGSIQASGCNVVVNSTSTSAMNLSGNTQIYSNTLCGPGGHNVSGSSRLIPGETACPAMTDPYAHMAVPAAASATNPCDYTNFQTSGNNYYSYKRSDGTTYSNTTGVSTITLSPGVYCGGITTGGYTNAVFQPGIYVLRNGGLDTGGNTTLSGSGVAFYITGVGTSVQLQNDLVDLSARTTLTITAPTSGDMKGIAIYQDNSAATGTLNNTLSGTSTINFTGLLYFGNQNVIVSGDSENQSAGFTCMIAYTLSYSGNASLYLNSNYASTTVPVPDGLKSSVQNVALTQ
jgi:Flp pilus assembly protein TadG